MRIVMPRETAAAIKNWIKKMGFKLVRSHNLNHRTTKINYYSLGTFGVYEEICKSQRPGKQDGGHKFISWTPWGIDFEVNSVRDLSKAYEEFVEYNPNVLVT
ncbi:MAG TPA: hypothetical protein VGE26_07985 [Sphingobacteriaceae bacterium]